MPKTPSLFNADAPGYRNNHEVLRNEPNTETEGKKSSPIQVHNQPCYFYCQSYYFYCSATMRMHFPCQLKLNLIKQSVGKLDLISGGRYHSTVVTYLLHVVAW